MGPVPTVPTVLTALAALCIGACARGNRTPAADALANALADARRDGTLVLVHFAAPDTPAGAAVLAEVLGDPGLRARLERGARLVELDAASDPLLFEAAFADGGRLGTCVLDETGEPMAAIPGAASGAELVGLLERCRSAALGWRASRADDLARARLLTELGLWHRAQALLEALLAAPAGRGRGGVGGEREAAARERLARCLVRRGEIAAGRRAVEDWRRRWPGRAHAGLDLTEGLALLGDREPRAALAALERAGLRGVDPPERDAWLLALGTARHQARAGDGLAQLEQLLERYPHSPWRRAARRQIEHVLSPPGPHDHGLPR